MKGIDMTQEQIQQTQVKIANLQKLAEQASTWSERCMIENTIDFLKRDLRYLGGQDEKA